MRRLGTALALLVVTVTAAGSIVASDPPDAVTTVFTIEGMHCDGCSAAITGALQRVEGVIEARADHEKGEAVAVYKRKMTSADELKQAIEKLGYTVTAMKTTAVQD